MNAYLSDLSTYTYALILLAVWLVTILLHAWLHDRAVSHEADRYAHQPADDEWHTQLADGAADPDYWRTVAETGYLPEQRKGGA